MLSLILAGGENRRFPRLKGFIEIEGKRLIERNLQVLREITGRVAISTNRPELYFYLNAPLIGDVIKSSGPMAGILSAFIATGAGKIFVTACDMPFLKPELIKYIIDSGSGEATVPLFGERPEPLLAVYSRSTMGTMEAMLGRGQRSLTLMLKELDVHYMGEGAIRKLDPGGESFFNINTPEDYEKAFGKTPVASRQGG